MVPAVPFRGRDYSTAQSTAPRTRLEVGAGTALEAGEHPRTEVLERGDLSTDVAPRSRHVAGHRLREGRCCHADHYIETRPMTGA